MNRTYTLKDGNRISAFIWDDVIKGEIWRKTIEVVPINKEGYHIGKETKHLMYKDVENGEVFFNYNDEKIFVNQYDYIPLDELIIKLNDGLIKNDRWYIRDDEILATFLMEHDKIGVVAEMPLFDIIVPNMGVALTGSETAEVLTIPRIDGKYPIDNWYYKITFEAEDEEIRTCVASNTYYFSDFCSLLRGGHIKLVNKDEYKLELQTVMEQKTKEDAKIINQIKSKFKRTKSEQHTVHIMNF